MVKWSIFWIGITMVLVAVAELRWLTLGLPA
jgi:hypothetical protein